jgi:hypothetical protein
MLFFFYIYTEFNLYNLLFRLSVQRLETMAQLHTYYITNSHQEICYPDSFSNNADEIQDAITAVFTPDDYDETIERDYSSDDEEFLDTDGLETILQPSDFLEIANYFDFNDAEFQQLMAVDIQVVIEPMQEITNHGEREFNIDEVLDSILNEYS